MSWGVRRRLAKLALTSDGPIAMTDLCWFHYQYRDAGNWKTPGRVLLAGRASAEREAAIRRTLESGDLFVPEQVGLPALQAQHLEECGVEDREGDDLDHAFHEFVGLKAARVASKQSSVPSAALDELIRRFEAIAHVGWDVRASPFGRW
ncbi:hypothetical protein [Arenimonas composti]|uniref:hypothetical protein n=1 Tax=Arenimonas composti TaxID=370776 RepID=UPI0012B5D77C|nr:hypothetical protein [Arenimonas composti]